MRSRQNYLLQGCILYIGILIPIIIVICIFLVKGPLPLVLNRLGVILQVLGISSVLPELIGENRLKQFQAKLSDLRKFQRQLRTYLTREDAKALYDLVGLDGVLTLVGNYLMCSLLIVSATYLLADFSHALPNYRLQYLLVVVSFTGLAIFAATWMLLFTLFWIFPLQMKPHLALLSIVVVLHDLISLLGSFISAPLAFLLRPIAGMLSFFVSRYSLRSCIMFVSVPITLLGLLFQLSATFF